MVMEEGDHMAMEANVSTCRDQTQIRIVAALSTRFAGSNLISAKIGKLDHVLHGVDLDSVMIPTRKHCAITLSFGLQV